MTVAFKQNAFDKSPIIFNCQKNDLISNVIEKYRLKSCDYRQNIKFIFGTQYLNELLTVNEVGIKCNENIFVVEI